MLYAMVTAVVEVVGKEDPVLGSELDETHNGTLGPGMISIDYGDTATTRIARGELELCELEDNKNLDSR